MNLRGFTLVELAIVMTIIGLLIGGILKGQELLENARVTSTVAQIKSYEAAVTAFRDIYDGLPGDLRNAGNRIPGCTGNCTPPRETSGDGVIGLAGGCNGSVTVATVNPAAGAEDETWLFWVHLMKANLISGVSDIGITEDVERSFGNTDPSAKIGGGFWAGSNMCTPDGYGVGGVTLTLDSSVREISTYVPSPRSADPCCIAADPFESLPDAPAPVSGQANMSPLRAAQIDRKMDDGKPSTGSVMSIGNEFGTCNSTERGNEYNEQVSSKDCRLLIGIQK